MRLAAQLRGSVALRKSRNPAWSKGKSLAADRCDDLRDESRCNHTVAGGGEVLAVTLFRIFGAAGMAIWRFNRNGAVGANAPDDCCFVSRGLRR